ncbi:MAG: 23S rRNA pseudouridine(2604) synthase RluF [Saprospiraceae bacterium]|nr:MAG: putative ribosomal RNA pseudouridine synthase [Bacteroidetes bacterium OLB9]MCO6464275.1 23S rRNA pseudouridine(2604) synthase RluF [Saprospiraceae bacterium]MCZ2337847.1 23S rRNA pseudouridine(2604) synthase RluF [Chitinophagales bacterium]
MDQDTISLNKYISDSGLCSRREADKLIEEGRVYINDHLARKGNRVGHDDVVYVNGKEVKSGRKTVYIALHKPVGIVCTTDAREPDNIIDYVKYSERIFPIGRLDKMSQGLILLTNDGNIVNKILRAGNRHEKEYIVTVDKDIDQAFVKTMEAGVPILDTVTRPSKVRKIDNKTFSIILSQGLNRQIRRMCEFLGYRVKKLIRIRIMHLLLDGIEYGKWRYLTEAEINQLLETTKKSKK